MTRAWLKRKREEVENPALASARAVAEHAELQLRLQSLQAVTGHAFRDQRLAVAALFATNSPNRAARHLTEQSGWTQHRLAWLGDSVLRLLVTMQFASDPKLSRAHESRCRLETNAFLAQRAKATGLSALSISAQVPNAQWPVATIVEAVLGAVFQDSGEDLQAARSVLCALGVLR